jgi:hypothetical protein
MTYRTWLKLAAVATATTAATLAIAADHNDGPKAKSDPAADITDVYTWLDGPNLVLVMNVFPSATAASKFSEAVQYWFHTTSGPAFGDKTSPFDIVCTFDAAQMISCWAGSEQVHGDASGEAGLASASGKLKVFAGLRDDPFFFNLTGFNTVATFVAANGSSLMYDPAGCPKIDMGASTTIVTTLKEDGMGNPGKDDFAGKNVLSIVVSIDKALLTEAGPIVSVWGATRAAN